MCKISKIKGLCNYIGNGNFEIFSEFQKIKKKWLGLYWNMVDGEREDN